MSDPLAPFRKAPRVVASQPATVSAPVLDHGEYIAFGVKDRVDCMKIHFANNPSRSPLARPHDIIYSPLGVDFVLLWDFLIIEVTGKNLLDVVHAIQAGTCDFIQEFDRDRWAVPKDTSAAFIESISVFVPKGAPDGKGQKGK